MKTAISYLRFSTKGQKFGDSARRQLSEFHSWCKANDLEPDETQTVFDPGLSAFKGEHITKKGALGIFRDAVVAGKFPNHVLVAENLDRISRQGPKIARKLIEQIVDNGVDIHIVTGNLKLTPGWENDTPRSVVVDVLLKQAWDYSQNLQKREKSVWTRKQEMAERGVTLTSKIPAWLSTPRFVKGAGHGGAITINEDRARIVKRIFQLAGEGYGCPRIVTLLNAEGRPAFGSKKAKWNPEYVRRILCSRAVLGEFQLHTVVDGVRVPLGDVIPNYYPRVIEPTEWEAARASVDARYRNRNKNGKPAGGKQSVNSLLTPLIHDANQNLRMRFQQKKGKFPYLVTAWNSGVKSNRFRYDKFEMAFLGFLEDLDWKEIAGQAEPPEVKEAQAELDRVLTELYTTHRVSAKFEALLQDPDLDTKFVMSKLQRATEEASALALRRDSLTASIKSARASADALYKPEELRQAILDGDPLLRERLKNMLAKRIARIDLTFNATVLTDGPVLVEPGTGKTVAKITFINNAVRWIFFQGEKAVLLS